VSWEPLNLAHIEERPPVQPTLGGLGLVYPGKRHVFSGPQEAAKTLAAYAIALAVIRDSGTVVLIDLEMGQWDARDRLRELGATDEDLERLLYIEPEAPATEEIILGLLDEWQPTLVVIDAAAGAYDLQGLDDNKRADVERFARVFVRSFWWRGVATILLDHVVKNADSRGKYAIGSERKVGGADVHLGFEVVTPLARGGLGLYKLTTHKDRGGWLPRPRAGELELRSDPETHAISWTFRPPANVDETDGFRPTALMERVSRYLEQQSEPISRTAIEEAVTGKVVYVRIAIDCLVRDGFASETSGARGARLVTSVHPYRDGDPVPTPSHEGDPDPVPTPSRRGPHSQAESATPSHPVPTPSPVPEPTPSQFRLPLQGGTDWRDGVIGEQEPPGLGDELYPVSVAEAVRDGLITNAEAQSLYRVHQLVERACGAT
jgi:GNAT superfamily N-acetyltransferase